MTRAWILIMIAAINCYTELYRKYQGMVKLCAFQDYLGLRSCDTNIFYYVHILAILFIIRYFLENWQIPIQNPD